MTLATLDHVTRRFGDLTALDDVTLEVPPGQILGLLGPNGAGKSTLLSLLMGLRAPTTGMVRLFGGDPRDPGNRTRLGSTPQETALPEPLKVREVIDFVGRHFPERVPGAELADMFGLTDLLKRQCGSLSGGQKRRLAVALAFAGRPDLVLLDEPTTGLDVDGRHTLWQALRDRHAAGATIVVTSHYLEEIEALAERVVVIGSGRVVADDSLARVVSLASTHQIRLRTPDTDRLLALPGVTRVDQEDGGITVISTTDSDALIPELVTSGITFKDLTVRGATLEEAFLALTEAPALTR
ncbi:ABC transporter ATP-binding protein [Microbacterium gorillae]|uniref:ABC transporter ATP-binding protein n=1 Tax=Microbacterium gorillae TaxID=1231063 RepID=UPI00059164F7|nr:ABC transporter ATP-binding protein [Microbacterium gorillae]